jgi:hypothetical protein
MLRYIKIVLFLLIFPVFVYSQSAEELSGVWHAASYIGSGYSDMFVLNGDGTFRFSYTEMDCSKRDIAFGGTWSLAGGRIILIKNYKEVLVRGKFKASSGSCGSDSALVDAIYMKIYIAPYETEVLSIGKVQKETLDKIERMTLIIGDQKYWNIGLLPLENKR